MQLWNRREKTCGLIAYYGLSGWWHSTFTKEERKLIDDRTGVAHGTQFSDQLVTDFLNVLAGRFASGKDASIAQRIRLKIDELGHANPVAGPGFHNGRHSTTYVEDVEALKRANRLDDAEKLLLELVAANEAEAEITKWGVPPWYYEQLAIIYRKQNAIAKEVAILKRYLAKTGRDAAEKNSLGSKLLDRLKKARAMFEADGAEPASNCPYCGVEIVPPPTRSGKCPTCGKKVIRSKRPGEEFATLFTIEQAGENKKGVELARARKRALDHTRKIGCTDSEFAAKERELAKKWGRTPSPNDIFWEISNELLSRASTFDKYSLWGKLHSIYEHQARVLVEEGKPHLQTSKEASKAHLHVLEEMCQGMGYKKEVHIVVGKKCCPECAKLDGQRMSISKALDSLPIPNEQCMHERCKCSWGIDYGDTFK